MTAGQIKSARRVIELFEMFGSVQHPLTVTEVCKRLNIPQSSTSELLQLLVSMDYLSYDVVHRTFFPTVRLSFLGSWINLNDQMARILPELVMQVSGQTDETATLALRNGINAHYAFVHNARHRSTDVEGGLDLAYIRSGHFKPLCCCASGWALMATESDETIEKLVRRTVSETPNLLWKKTARHALEQVKLYRQRGYAHSEGQGVEGIAGISVRLPRSEHRPPLAVTISGPIARIAKKKSKILRALYALSKEIAGDLEEPHVS